MLTKIDFVKYSFALPLKRAAAEMFGLPLERFLDGDDREIEDPFWGISPRRILQLLGTEGGRELFREDIWIKRAELELRKYQEADTGMVVADVRFPNEAQWIREMGGLLIHVVRPGMESVAPAHASEAGYSDDLKDVILYNDGTIEDLYKKVDNVLVGYGLVKAK
jgi:hypothetical protein